MRRRSTRIRPTGRLVAVFVASVAVAAFLLLGFFPTRTFLGQRSATAAAEEDLARLRAEKAALRRRIERLSTPQEIERIARRDYGLIRPGEEAWVVLPPPPPPVELPEIWPFKGVADELNR